MFLIYVACEIGFHGDNCQTLCIYPSYGKNCHMECNCTIDNCNHVWGCRKESEGTFSLHFISSLKLHLYFVIQHKIVNFCCFCTIFKIKVCAFNRHYKY